MVALAALGPRVAGTEADRRAAEYVAESLRSSGYTVRIEPFRFPFFQTRRVHLQVLSPRPLALSPRAMIYSASTPGPVTASLVAAGKGLERDFAGVDASGKVVLVERGEIPFAEKARDASRSGAVAVVVYNHEPGSVVGTLGSRSQIPVVSIPREEGLVLLEMLREGPVTVSLDVQTTNEERTAHNMVGATGRATRKLVVGAHEELGLFGSQAYVRSRGIAGVVGMVNLDMVGVGERFLVGNTGQDDRLVEITLPSRSWWLWHAPPGWRR